MRNPYTGYKALKTGRYFATANFPSLLMSAKYKKNLEANEYSLRFTVITINKKMHIKRLKLCTHFSARVPSPGNPKHKVLQVPVHNKHTYLLASPSVHLFSTQYRTIRNTPSQAIWCVFHTIFNSLNHFSSKLLRYMLFYLFLKSLICLCVYWSRSSRTILKMADVCKHTSHLIA